jgi:hypothetical protein
MKDENPTDLDDRRSAAGLMGAEMRRHALQGLEADRERRRVRDAALEAQMLAGPAETWPDAAAKAIYLLRLLAPAPEAQDARIARLLERAVVDLDWLSRRDRHAPPGDAPPAPEDGARDPAGADAAPPEPGGAEDAP